MHVFKYALVAINRSIVRALFDVINIVQTPVIQIVPQSGEQQEESFEGAEVLFELAREVACLVGHLNDIMHTKNTENAWEKLW